MGIFEFPFIELPAGVEALRGEVRAFLREQLKDRPVEARARSWTGVDYDFTRKVAQKGWVGMALPKSYGGQDKSILERYVVVEELLAAGAPVAAYWAADRQIGPLILRYGTDEQKQ